MKLQGRVAFQDLESGVWVLRGDDGRVYQLAGGDRRIKRDGARVEVEGELDETAVSSAMVGPVFQVRKYRFLDLT